METINKTRLFLWNMEYGIERMGSNGPMSSRAVTVSPTCLGRGRLLCDEGHHPRHQRRQRARPAAPARLPEQLRRQPAQQGDETQANHTVEAIIQVCFILLITF